MATVSTIYHEALSHHAGGRTAPAELCCRAVLESQPRHADAWHLLGLIAHEQGRHEHAAELVHRAIDYSGANPAHFNTLGLAFAALGDHERAVEQFRLATLLAADFAEAHSNLGASLRGLGDWHDAEASLRKALELRPDFIEARFNLGLVLHALGRRAEAIVALQEVRDSAPAFGPSRAVLVAAWTELASMLLEVGHHEQAEASLRRALEVQPTYAPALGALAQVLAEQGRLEAASEHLRAAIEQAPNDRLRLQNAILLPPIYDSAAEVQERRQTLIAELERLECEGLRIDPNEGPLPTLFWLAYQGENDVEVHRQFARLIARPEPFPTADRTRSAEDRIRVGFISVHFRDHTIGKLMQGMIGSLSRAAFTVVVLADKIHDDPTGRAIRESADEFITFGRDVNQARHAIAECDLDILIYTDLGMDGLTPALACSRLAPVQCVTWGHPATTGLDTIDWFLSSELLETADADGHYSERLLRLPTLPIYYHRPEAPSPLLSRAELGLPAAAHLYACPQSLFKLHPEFDAILGAILRRDPLGRLVLLRGRHEHWEALLRQRFERTMPEVTDRILFIDSMDRSRFLSLNAAVDVLLDPIHFGGGNTSYEAFALGKAIVTWPSPYLKGRITQALYRMMDIRDCIAFDEDSYADIAVRLGTDSAWREAIEATIRRRCHVLFEDEAAVADLERFLQGVATAAFTS